MQNIHKMTCKKEKNNQEETQRTDKKRQTYLYLYSILSVTRMNNLVKHIPEVCSSMFKRMSLITLISDFSFCADAVKCQAAP